MKKFIRFRKSRFTITIIHTMNSIHYLSWRPFFHIVRPFGKDIII